MCGFSVGDDADIITAHPEHINMLIKQTINIFFIFILPIPKKGNHLQ